MKKIKINRPEESSFNDIVLLLSAGFVVLFIMALIYVNPVAKIANIKKPITALITVTWPDESAADVDIWVMSPDGTITNYMVKNPKQSPISLDRDDLGSSNDTFFVDGEPVVLRKNYETVSFRFMQPGDYVSTIHYYNNISELEDGAIIPVNVRLESFDPSYKLKYETKTPIMLSYIKQEVIAVRWSVDHKGNIYNVSTSPFLSLIDTYHLKQKMDREEQEEIQGIER